MELSSVKPDEESVKPDVQIETYWFAIKSVLQMIVSSFNDMKPFIKIDKWSAILNELQKQSRYAEIEQTIEYLLKKVFMIVMKKNNPYLFGLLYTQLERWNKTHLIGLEKEHAQHRIFKYDEHLYVEILVKLAHVLYRHPNKNSKELTESIFKDINVKIKFNVDQDKIMTNIIQKLVDNNKSGCLDIVFEFVDKVTIIKKIYGIDLSNGRGKTCKGKHLIVTIKKKEDAQFDS